MQNDNNEQQLVELRPENIYGYWVTTQDYTEENDDRRKKPMFLWRAYTLYPMLLIQEEDEDLEQKETYAVLTEGGDRENVAYIPMEYDDIKEFLHDHPQFRWVDEEEIFETYKIR